MKLIVIFVAFFGFVASQDVPVPVDLLNRTNQENLVSQGTDIPPPDEIKQWAKKPQFRPRCAESTGYECDVITPYPDVDVDLRFPEPEIFDQVGPSTEIVTVDPVTVTENRTPITDTIYECPIGKIRRGGFCETVNPQECQRGYELRHGMCVSVEVQCPVNFVRQGTRCVQSREICPNLYVWRGGRCEPEQPQCPPGLFWNGHKCEYTNMECPVGFVLSGNECRKEEYDCKPDEHKVDGICYKNPVECPTGFSLNPSGFCYQTRTSCPFGYSERNGECVKEKLDCPEGYRWDGHTCVRIIVLRPDPTWTTPRTPRPRSPNRPTLKSVSQQQHCPPGYNYYNGLCYQCSASKSDCKQCDRPGGCTEKNTCCSSQGGSQVPSNININVYGSTDRGGSGTPGGYNIVNRIEPANNTIININNITNPVTLNNHNENNIHIYGGTKCADGSIRTVVVRNNETVNSCTEAVTEPDSEPIEPKKCCEVVTPRQCKKRGNENWGCQHRRYKYCGDFCASDRVYLRPRSTVYSSGVLTMAPSYTAQVGPQCYGGQCPAVDCSGCMDGSSNCSSQCSTYPCNQGECTYLDQEDFCGTVGGRGCQ